MLYITTPTCTSSNLSTVCCASQDTMAGWHHCCIPQVRRDSNERRLLPEPVSSSVPCRRIIGQRRSQNCNQRAWLSRDGFFFDRYLVPLLDNHCVQQRRLPVGGTTVARILVQSIPKPLSGSHPNALLKDTVQTLTKLQRCKSPLRTSPIPFSSPKNGVTVLHVSCLTAVAKKRIRRTGTVGLPATTIAQIQRGYRGVVVHLGRLERSPSY